MLVSDESYCIELLAFRACRQVFALDVPAVWYRGALPTASSRTDSALIVSFVSFGMN